MQYLKIQAILRDSKFSLSVFNHSEIQPLEEKLTPAKDKKGNPYYVAECPRQGNAWFQMRCRDKNPVGARSQSKPDDLERVCGNGGINASPDEHASKIKLFIERVGKQGQ